MAQPRAKDRRQGDAPDTGERRRSEDYIEVQRELARLGSRMDTVEGIAAILDGRGVPGYGGIIGTLGGIQAELVALREAVKELGEDVERCRTDVGDIKLVTGKIDGNTQPPGRWERVFTTMIPVLVAVVSAFAVVAAAYFTFKGQVTQLGKP